MSIHHPAKKVATKHTILRKSSVLLPIPWGLRKSESTSAGVLTRPLDTPLVTSLKAWSPSLNVVSQLHCTTHVCISGVCILYGMPTLAIDQLHILVIVAPLQSCLVDNDTRIPSGDRIEMQGGCHVW